MTSIDYLINVTMPPYSPSEKGDVSKINDIKYIHKTNMGHNANSWNTIGFYIDFLTNFVNFTDPEVIHSKNTKENMNSSSFRDTYVLINTHHNNTTWTFNNFFKMMTLYFYRASHNQFDNKSSIAHYYVHDFFSTLNNKKMRYNIQNYTYHSEKESNVSDMTLSSHNTEPTYIDPLISIFDNNDPYDIQFAIFFSLCLTLVLDENAKRFMFKENTWSNTNKIIQTKIGDICRFWLVLEMAIEMYLGIDMIEDLFWMKKKNHKTIADQYGDPLKEMKEFYKQQINLQLTGGNLNYYNQIIENDAEFLYFIKETCSLTCDPLITIKIILDKKKRRMDNKENVHTPLDDMNDDDDTSHNEDVTENDVKMVLEHGVSSATVSSNSLYNQKRFSVDKDSINHTKEFDTQLIILWHKVAHE